MDYDIAVVGAGAAGLMAAAAAAKSIPGERILLLEKNPAAGKKLYATGNGRCNFLNRSAVKESYFARECGGSAADWVGPALEKISPERLEKIFCALGIPAVEEAEGRLYPRSLQAESVAEALLLAVEAAGAELRVNETVTACRKTAGGFVLESGHRTSVSARCVILSTGGKAGLQYGSQGDGYKLAAALGHRIVKPIPALTQLLLDAPDPELFGVRVRARISLRRHCGGKRESVAVDTGEVQLTREGLSGICTFNISRFYEIAESTDYTAALDFFPESSPEQLLAILRERRCQLARRPGMTFLNGLLPLKLARAILKEAGVFEQGKTGDLSEESMRRIAAICKNYERKVKGTKSWKDAQVTAGGVSLEEVDPSRLLSRLVPGLYFAGEILDVDGPCGGYNLTWAFASGWIAGTAAGEAICCV
jgi:predicted Rossmann fold flavoprotein